MNAPIALFVYARPEHTKKTVEALQQNTLASQSDLVVFADAAKHAELGNKCQEVREYIRTIEGFKTVTIHERNENWGLAKSIINGVSELVKSHGRVIVLEDDLVTSPYFLEYMNAALDRYQNDEQVMHISGYMFPIEQSGLAETFFLRTASCWGWATWARAWQHFEKDAEALIGSFSRETIKRFNMDGTYDFWTQVLKNQTKEINTWAVFWYATVFQKQGLCLHPAISMTVNIGIDGTGIHCGNNDVFNTALAHRPIARFTDILNEDPLALKKLKVFFRSLRPTWFSKVNRRIKSVYIKVSSCF
ncbi:MAG TPA: glycosyltransferase family 2 protein [Methylophilaceae bacterium]|nr:glycosyltransferase family 2 protein [Methylophilaceae bacterium]